MTEGNSALSLAGPESLAIYNALLTSLREIGDYQVEVKKTSIHLVRKTAFAGVHPRRQYLVLTIKAAQPIARARIAKAEQVSKNRWHLDVKLTSLEQIDAELIAWLREAY
ncbi:MAG: DUF5655 domain-containing protein, partial [Bryobacteraceae bacterium]